MQQWLKTNRCKAHCKRDTDQESKERDEEGGGRTLMVLENGESQRAGQTLTYEDERTKQMTSDEVVRPTAGAMSTIASRIKQQEQPGAKGGVLQQPQAHAHRCSSYSTRREGFPSIRGFKKEAGRTVFKWVVINSFHDTRSKMNLYVCVRKLYENCRINCFSTRTSTLS